jgi:hypothetical protein
MPRHEPAYCRGHRLRSGTAESNVMLWLLCGKTMHGLFCLGWTKDHESMKLRDKRVLQDDNMKPNAFCAGFRREYRFLEVENGS